MTTDPDRLIHAHIEDNLTAEQSAELSAWIELSDANAEHFVRCCVQHYLLREQAVGKDLAESVFSEEDTNAEADEDPTRPGLFEYLANVEAPSPAEMQPIHIGSSTPLTKKAYASALTYVLEHTFTPKRIAMLATAAALLLGAVLAIVLLVDSGKNDLVVEQAPSSVKPKTFTPTIVATLTAEHDAVWDRRPGQDLYAGQRAALTEGFAEITTSRGAVVLLEAPCTIELSDNNNSLYLHRGRLVGICETESSKGFLVRTPHMDVTDLGTRFGVDVSDDNRSNVHVFEGKVEVSRQATPGRESIRAELTAGQAASLSRDGLALISIPIRPDRFAAVHPDGSLNRTVLTDHRELHLDLVDILAGGDGTGRRELVGIDAVTGQYRNDLPAGQWMRRPSQGKYYALANTAYTIGVVALKDNSVSGLPASVSIPDPPATSGSTFGLVWCGGQYPSSGHGQYPAVMAGVDYAVGTHRALYLHANSMIVIDLASIRAAYPDMRIARIEAVVGNTTAWDAQLQSRLARARFQVGLDRMVVADHLFDLSDPGSAGPAAIQTQIGSASHLSLISSDGGDGVDLDRIVLGDPRLVLEPINQ